MSIQQWEKTLSKTDTGESSTHQSGILINVREGERMFPNGTGKYQCLDDLGIQWEIKFTDKAKRSESRITFVREWLNRFSVTSGDRVILSTLHDGIYRLSHIPKDANPIVEVEDLSSFPEGAKEQISVNRYERNKQNRERAIAFHGIACLACNTRMAEMYGEIAGGFIHIHHTKSLSDTGEYTPNIETDLIPLCPNCHSIVHLTNPPMTLEELKCRMEDT